MTDTLNPKALKYHRKQNGLSQQALADKSRVSKAQISRYERGIQTERVGKTNRERLCDALHVTWEKLTREPESQDLRSNINRVALKDGISGSARTALTFMQLRFGLTEEAIIDLAPLAFLILAEHSLQARKAALDETVQALEDATRDACRRLPYLCGAFRDGYLYDWIEEERKSLERRDVYAEYVSDEGEEMSPFVDFLEKELKTLGLFQKYPVEFSSRYRSNLHYAIPVESLARLLGLDAADDSDRGALELIQEGDIDLRQALEKKKEADEEGYQSWLDEQCAVVKEKRQSFLDDFLRDIDISLDTPKRTKSDDESTNAGEKP